MGEQDHASETGDNQTIANQLMKNPGVLAALQDKLCPGSPNYLQSLPKEVKRRIKALKKLQNEVIHTEAQFYKEISLLEMKYIPLYTQLFDKRKDILLGKIEPTAEECEWPSDYEEDEKGTEDVSKLTVDLKDKVTMQGTKEASGDASKQPEFKGVPNFWLTIFKSVGLLSELVQEHDEPILVHLQDIKTIIHDKDPVGFSLEFYFEPNEYFTNSVLTKRYEMRYEPDQYDPFSYEGPEIIKCEGCTINWNKGKNVTVKQVKKKLKHKGRGMTRTVTKQIEADSFFNFFDPPTVPEKSDPEEEDEIEATLGSDFEIGHFLRERIIPRAVLFFTGEAMDNYDEEENEEVEEDNYEDEHESDFNAEESN